MAETTLHDPANPEEIERRKAEHDSCACICHAGAAHSTCPVPGGCWRDHDGAPNPATVCVLGCRDRSSRIWPRPPRRRAEGLLTCRPCADAFVGKTVDDEWKPGLLDELLELAALVALHLEPGSRVLDPSGRSQGRRRPASPAPLSVPVASLTDVRGRTEQPTPTPGNVIAFLDSWADRIRIGRQLGAGSCDNQVLGHVMIRTGPSGGWQAWPRHQRCGGQLTWRRGLLRWPLDAAWPALLTQCTSCGDRRPAEPDGSATVMTAIALLRRHNEWICAQPWVARYSRGLRAMLAELKAASGIPRPRKVGACPNTVDDRRGTQCGAVIYADPEAESTTCTACGREYTRKEYRHLGRLIGQTGKAAS